MKEKPNKLRGRDLVSRRLDGDWCSPRCYRHGMGQSVCQVKNRLMESRRVVSRAAEMEHKEG